MTHDERHELDTSDPSTIAQTQIHFPLNTKIDTKQNLISKSVQSQNI